MKTASVTIHVENCLIYGVSIEEYKKKLAENEFLKNLNLSIEVDLTTEASCISILDETGSHLTGIICTSGYNLSKSDLNRIPEIAQKIFQELRPKYGNSTNN